MFNKLTNSVADIPSSSLAHVFTDKNTAAAAARELMARVNQTRMDPRAFWEMYFIGLTYLPMGRYAKHNIPTFLSNGSSTLGNQSET